MSGIESKKNTGGRPKCKCDWCKHDQIQYKSSFIEKDQVYNLSLCGYCHVLFKTINNTYSSARIP